MDRRLGEQMGCSRSRYLTSRTTTFGEMVRYGWTGGRTGTGVGVYYRGGGVGGIRVTVGGG